MAFLRAFGSHLPERIVTNEELAPQLEVDPEWIYTQSGIRTRHYAAEQETVASLAKAAAEDCLRKAGKDPEDLALILVACGSPTVIAPAQRAP